jgi:hypothetical protein
LAATDPLNIAEALVNAQQDAAREQMEDALLRMAQGVVRASGGPAAAEEPIDGSRT